MLTTKKEMLKREKELKTEKATLTEKEVAKIVKSVKYNTPVLLKENLTFADFLLINKELSKKFNISIKENLLNSFSLFLSMKAKEDGETEGFQDSLLFLLLRKENKDTTTTTTIISYAISDYLNYDLEDDNIEDIEMLAVSLNVNKKSLDILDEFNFDKKPFIKFQ